MNNFFRKFAQWTSHVAGTPGAFVVAAFLILVWAVTGPLFHFSTTWQLMVNTGTTILTFLMVFLIQNTQNRDAHAVHLKLDEIIRSIDSARNELIDAEDLEDKVLEAYGDEFRKLRDVRREQEQEQRG
ncbi:MAG TPA: low affinity iron permease family protein [Candidatus Paceibacterota bacterium]|nr:low affinity iron permease family protein [Candidatus Paceibacterota bacterium]